jgi:maltose O-acetyltransferase
MINSSYLHFVRQVTSVLGGSPFRKLRIALWRLGGIDIDWEANIYPSVSFMKGEKGTNLKVGKGSFCGYEVMICGGDVQIGERCDIAPRCTIHAGTHELGDAGRRAGRAYSGKIVIGDGTWCGTGVTVLAGAVIGSGCVVAAGSVVIAGTYPDHVLLAGVPARVVRVLDETKRS